MEGTQSCYLYVKNDGSPLILRQVKREHIAKEYGGAELHHLIRVDERGVVNADSAVFTLGKRTIVPGLSPETKVSRSDEERGLERIDERCTYSPSG